MIVIELERDHIDNVALREILTAVRSGQHFRHLLRRNSLANFPANTLFGHYHGLLADALR